MSRRENVWWSGAMKTMKKKMTRPPQKAISAPWLKTSASKKRNAMTWRRWNSFVKKRNWRKCNRKWSYGIETVNDWRKIWRSEVISDLKREECVWLKNEKREATEKKCMKIISEETREEMQREEERKRREEEKRMSEERENETWKKMKPINMKAEGARKAQRLNAQLHQLAALSASWQHKLLMGGSSIFNRRKTKLKKKKKKKAADEETEAMCEEKVWSYIVKRRNENRNEMKLLKRRRHEMKEMGWCSGWLCLLYYKVVQSVVQERECISVTETAKAIGGAGKIMASKWINKSLWRS